MVFTIVFTIVFPFQKKQNQNRGVLRMGFTIESETENPSSGGDAEQRLVALLDGSVGLDEQRSVRGAGSWANRVLEF